MKKTFLIVTLVAAILIVGYMLGERSASTVHAQNQCSVPKSYGSAKLVTFSSVIFEDANGTLRSVDVDKGCKLTVLIVRQ